MTTDTEQNTREMYETAKQRGSAALLRAAQTSPEWYAQFLVTDCDMASRDELLMLLENVPDDGYFGYMYSKFITRIMFSEWSGSSFESMGLMTPEREAEVYRVVREKGSTYLHQLFKANPDWFHRFNEIDPDICTRDELVEIMCTAPTDFSFCYLYAKFSTRTLLGEWSGSRP